VVSQFVVIALVIVGSKFKNKSYSAWSAFIAGLRYELKSYERVKKFACHIDFALVKMSQRNSVSSAYKKPKLCVCHIPGDI